jgi:serine/threonine protein kinase
MIANEISRACDVYSFGVIMFELLTFQIPFDPLTKEQVRYVAGVGQCVGVAGLQHACLCRMLHVRGLVSMVVR